MGRLVDDREREREKVKYVYLADDAKNAVTQLIPQRGEILRAKTSTFYDHPP